MEHLASRARYCQEALAHLGLNPISRDGLHVTMTKVGDVADVTHADLARLVRSAGELLIDPFQATAHPLAGSPGAVRFSLTPWTPFLALHAVLSSLGRRVGVPGGSPTAGFRPHLGIAYSPCVRRAAPVIEAVAALRHLPPVPLDIGGVDLVELRREGTAYHWDAVASVPFGNV